MRILRLPGVIEKVNLSKPSIYRLVKEGRFPRPLELGDRARGWRESDIDAWIEERPQAKFQAEN